MEEEQRQFEVITIDSPASVQILEPENEVEVMGAIREQGDREE